MNISCFFFIHGTMKLPGSKGYFPFWSFFMVEVMAFQHDRFNSFDIPTLNFFNDGNIHSDMFTELFENLHLFRSVSNVCNLLGNHV